MQQNRHLAQAIADVGWGEFKRQMAYKGSWYGCEVRFADRFFPSTKRCSGCGHEREIDLSEREYVCENPGCGLVLDRDVNAARNLVQLFED
jgi:putative transposase